VEPVADLFHPGVHTTGAGVGLAQDRQLVYYVSPDVARGELHAADAGNSLSSRTL